MFVMNNIGVSELQPVAFVTFDARSEAEEAIQALQVRHIS
mgnify:CR=1 FL=1